MAGLFDRTKVKSLTGKEIIAFKDPTTNKILNVESSVLLSQIFDLDKLGQRCLTYPINTVTDCETEEEVQQPLQIADVLDVFEQNICDLQSNQTNDDFFTANGVLEYGIIYRPDLGDLTYEVWAKKYIINNVLYEDEIREIVTLNEGDDTHPRYDLFVIFNDGQGTKGAKALEGTPDANPQEPQLENAYQIEVGFKQINPNQTNDTDYSRETVYNENLGSPNEWDITATPNDGNSADNTDPFQGAVFFNFGTPSSFKAAQFTKSSVKVFDASDILAIGIKNLSGIFNSQERIQVRITNITSTNRLFPAIIDITSENASIFDLDPNSDDWQYARIPFSGLGGWNFDYDTIYINSNLNSVVHFDDIHIISGNPTTSTPSKTDEYRLKEGQGTISLVRGTRSTEQIVSTITISTREIITGAIGDDTFQLSTLPLSVDLFIDGVLQIPTVDYNLNNSQIVLVNPLIGASTLYVRKF